AVSFSGLRVPLDVSSEPDRKSSALADSSQGSSKSQPHLLLVTLQYPTPPPHGVFEQAVHRLLLAGLLFWGKQTDFVGRDYASGVYDGMLIVPRSVLGIADELWKTVEREPSHIQTSEQDTSKDLKTIGEGVREGISALQRYLYRYWSLVAAMRDG